MSTAPNTPAPPVDNVKANGDAVATAAPAGAAAKPAEKPVGNGAAANPVSKAAAPKTAKTAAKPLAKAFAQTAKPTSAAKPPESTRPEKAQKSVKVEMPAKPKKLKLISDEFKLLKEEFAALDALRKRAAKAGLPAKKNALVRAAIKALAAMSDTEFAAALDRLSTPKAVAVNRKKS